MERRLIARNLAWIRVAVGALLLLAPGLLGRLIVGRDASRPVGRMLLRGLAMRDLVLGVGLLRATELGHDDHDWLMFAAASDAVDALATLVAFGQLPRRRRWLLLATAVGSTGAALVASTLEPMPTA